MFGSIVGSCKLRVAGCLAVIRYIVVGCPICHQILHCGLGLTIGFGQPRSFPLLYRGVSFLWLLLGGFMPEEEFGSWQTVNRMAYLLLSWRVEIE
jgi:hypothetical protein